MAGLMRGPEGQQQQQPGAAQQQSGASAVEESLAGDEVPASPEEQAEYEEFVTKGMDLMYNDKAMEEVIRSALGDSNPIEGLANTLVVVVKRLEDSAGEAGREFSGDVKLHAARELLEQLVELVEATGAHEFTEEEMESAFYLALDTYRTIKQESGELPVEDLQEDMQMLVQAEQQGQLDQLVPGLEEYAKRAPTPESVGEGRKGGQPQRMQKG